MDRPDQHPVPRRGETHRSPWASPAMAGALALVVVVLIGAIVIEPGLVPSGSASPSASLDATCNPADTTTASCAPAATGTAPPPSVTPGPSFVYPTPTPGPTLTSYVVKAGESLTSIARAFATSPRSIAWWNRGTYPSLDPESEGYDPNHIEPGWTLVLMPGVIVDGANPPTGSPLPTGGAIGGGSPATVISNGPRGTTMVALTFDMGGRLDPAVDIVTWLIDHDVHATLFPTGKSGSTTDQGRAALQLAATRPDLFAFGNHSWDHPDFTTLSPAQMADQLTASETAIHDLIGGTTKPWFRPPFGAWTAAVRTGVGAAGWADLILWDVDTIDWRTTADGGPTADDIVAKVVSKALGGSIVLMHLGGWHTLEALPGLLAGLQTLGLTPVTLPEMLGN